MKQKLVAIALFVGSLVAGTYFVNWETAELDTTLPDAFGAFESYDRSRCTSDPCTTAPCLAARRHLDDAGFTNAVLREVECPFRIGQKVRNLAADAGFAFSASPYQQIRLVAMRRPGIDGGFSFAIATKENGWPMDAIATGVFPCAWRPSLAATCLQADGGAAPVRATMQPGQWSGAGCVRKACVELAGTPSDP